MMLGLSFMGQPFLSLACLNERETVGGEVHTRNASVGVAEIRANGGHCTGYDTATISSWSLGAAFSHPVSLGCRLVSRLWVRSMVFWSRIGTRAKSAFELSQLQIGYAGNAPELQSSRDPSVKESFPSAPSRSIDARGGSFLHRFPAATHGADFRAPRQNPDHCEIEHARLDFGPKVSQSPPSAPVSRIATSSVCYRYTFNIRKTVSTAKPPPCSWNFSDVDVIFSLFPTDEILREFLPRSGAPPLTELAGLTVVSVLGIYEALLIAQLQAAHRRYGLDPVTRADLLATPQTCERRDVHYALPGLTDHAVKVWWSMLATGLDDPHAATRQGRRIPESLSWIS